MATILDIHNPWRDALKPASFRGAQFFCEVGNKSNGRRIVVHEFPKKDIPYSEDMGRRAKTFTVRAYCIMSSRRGNDYRPMRDALVSALEQNGPGKLQLPTIPAEQVVVTRYRLTEDEKLGGYCVFEIEFAEAGSAPGALAPSTNTAGALSSAADSSNSQAAAGMK
jgi:prophage DNA circulation protein